MPIVSHNLCVACSGFGGSVAGACSGQQWRVVGSGFGSVVSIGVAVVSIGSV